MFRKIVPRLLFVAFAVIFAVYTYVWSVNKEPEFGALVEYTLASLLLSGALVIWEYFQLKNLARELVAVLFGMTAGLFAACLLLVIAGLFLVAYNLVNSTESTASISDAILAASWQIQFFMPLVLASCLYIGVTVVLQTRDNFRFLIPYIDFSQRGTQEGGLLLDSSALIDGRILEICRAGAVSVPLIIPDYVLRELQMLADGKDKLKRERGRRGLDIAADLRKMEGVRATVRSSISQSGAVDDRLVADARELNARILTTDFNLNKLGKAEGVMVVNVNEIAAAVKPQYIPGDELQLRLIRKGQEPGQGVGYLEDGTMVVVENAERYIGGNAERIRITGNIQTSAGRMIFGVPAEGAEANANN